MDTNAAAIHCRQRRQTRKVPSARSGLITVDARPAPEIRNRKCTTPTSRSDADVDYHLYRRLPFLRGGSTCTAPPLAAPIEALEPEQLLPAYVESGWTRRRGLLICPRDGVNKRRVHPCPAPSRGSTPSLESREKNGQKVRKPFVRNLLPPRRVTCSHVHMSFSFAQHIEHLEILRSHCCSIFIRFSGQ
jgi:hypothetical protein